MAFAAAGGGTVGAVGEAGAGAVGTGRIAGVGLAGFAAAGPPRQLGWND